MFKGLFLFNMICDFSNRFSEFIIDIGAGEMTGFVLISYVCGVILGFFVASFVMLAILKRIDMFLEFCGNKIVEKTKWSFFQSIFCKVFQKTTSGVFIRYSIYSVILFYTLDALFFVH